MSITRSLLVRIFITLNISKDGNIQMRLNYKRDIKH